MIKGFTATKSNVYVPIQDDGVFLNNFLVECSMRVNQQEVFDNHRDERFMIVSQPPGSGKSTIIKFIHAHDLEYDPSRKVVIAVPQTIIGKTFRKVVLVYPTGQRIEWDVENDLCTDSSDQKVQDVVRFLERKEFPRGIHERVCLCTHATLAKAHATLLERGTFAAALVNTTYVIDEAHHILSSQDSELENRLGSFISGFLNINDLSAKLWLTTATPFRGDRLPMVPPGFQGRFANHYLPMDKHWETLKYIQSYSFDFMIYSGDPWAEFRNVLKRGKKKTIIYAPAANRPLARGCKYAFTEMVKKIIKEEWGESNILDLVDDRFSREDKKRILENEDEASRLDVIIAISMVDEGTDWPDAEQVVDFTPSQSLRIVVQRWGRVLRDRKGKQHLHYYMMLPFCLNQVQGGEEGYRDALNRNFAAFTASLLIEDCIKPIDIPKPVMPGGTTVYTPSPFHLALPDAARRQELVIRVEQGLLILKGQADKWGNHLSTSDIRDNVERTIRDFGIQGDVTPIAKSIVAMLRRRAVAYDLDVSWTVEQGFEKVWRDEIFDNLLSFVTGVCDIKTFAEFREIFESRENKNWDEMYQLAKAEAEQAAK